MHTQHVSRRLLWLVAIAFLASPLAAQADFQIVVHADRELGPLTAREMSRLFLKKDKTWPDGSKVRPIDQPQRSRVRLDFLEDVHDFDEEGYARYWVRLVFSGRAKPPEIASDDADVVRRVQQDPDAIGYVSARATVPSNLKVLPITPTPE